MWRRCWRLLGATNRYTDGSGRRLDTTELPRELHPHPISNRAYPATGAHWQPVLAGEPAPHKGNVFVAGGGVVGLTVASLFALRGWHTTVVEQTPPVIGVPPQSMYTGRNKINEEDERETGAVTSSSARYRCRPFLGLEHALLTRRGVDALEAAGLNITEIKQCGVPVTGVMDHPGAYNSWLTRGLTEHHPFALKMLSVDLLALRQVLEMHVHTLPTGNCCVFHEYVVEAVYPLKQQLVVKPISKSHTYMQRMQKMSRDDEDGRKWKVKKGENNNNNNSNNNNNRSDDARKEEEEEAMIAGKNHHHMETSLTLHRAKWEKKFASDAVNYDLLVAADGVDSHLRDLMDVEGFAADADFAVRWLLLETNTLSHSHIHRWLHKQNKREHVNRVGVCSPCQVSLAIAFPRLSHEKTEENNNNNNNNSFALMIYGPSSDLKRLSDSEVLSTFCPDIAEHNNNNNNNGGKSYCHVVSFTNRTVPYPTIYCENLFNSVGLPSAVVIADAAHTCNPFWLQGLAIGLEDGVNLLNQVDAYSRHFYDAVKQYSQERGCSGDALREITDRCLYYERMKHINPYVRFQNSYQRAMNMFLPQMFNEYYSGASVNHLYSKSLEDMLNGRGYTSYEYAEKQQAKHRAFFHIGRVYT